MNTLNDLTNFARTVSAGRDEDCARRDAEQTFAVATDLLAGAILKAEGEPVGPEVRSMDEAVRDLFWGVASLAMAFNLDLNDIVDKALPEYQTRHAISELATVLAEFGITL